MIEETKVNKTILGSLEMRLKEGKKVEKKRKNKKEKG